MKKITKILILLTIPIQLCIIYGMIHGAPFCYFGIRMNPEFIYDNTVMVPHVGSFAACYWGIDAFFKSYLAHSLAITSPVMLVAFLIYYVKNSRKKINE